MKRTPLQRKTPLARGTSQLRRTPLKSVGKRRRTSLDPDLHRHVVTRDGCVLARWYPDHRCSRLGTPHGRYAYDLLTVDHVWASQAESAKGKKPPDDARHLCGMCYDGNVGAPSHEVRERERDYLADLEAKGRL